MFYLTKYATISHWKHIWVDAICINQDNIPERNSQIAQMREVYLSAYTVSVWLELIYEPKTIPWHEEVITIDVENWDWCDQMYDLANRAYWSRVWVVQEFLLARSIDYYCSGVRVDERTFSGKVGEHLKASSSFGLRPAEGIDYDPQGRCHATALVAARNPDEFPELAMPLEDLLVRYRRADCKRLTRQSVRALGFITDRSSAISSRTMVCSLTMS